MSLRRRFVANDQLGVLSARHCRAKIDMMWQNILELYHNHRDSSYYKQMSTGLDIFTNYNFKVCT